MFDRYAAIAAIVVAVALVTACRGETRQRQADAMPSESTAPSPTGTPTRAATPIPLTAIETPIRPTTTPTLEENFQGLTRRFDYSGNLPLDVQEGAVAHHGEIQVHDISYRGRSDTVAAYLVVPPGAGPFPAVIFLHWGFGDRDEFLDEALQLGELGVVALLIDSPFARGASIPPEGRQAAYIDAVADCRRGVDLLLARPGVDPERIAFVGHSFGATWGGVLAGVERRIKAYVLMAGYARVSQFDDSVGADFDAANYLRHAAPAALFFQFAERDSYVPKEDALLSYAMASEPKAVRWYNADHSFNDEARQERLEWLRAQLGLGPGTLLFSGDLFTGLQPLSPANSAEVAQLRILSWPEGVRSRVQCSVDFAPDQRRIAAACFNRYIPLWDLDDGALERTILGHAMQVVALDFAADGQTLATGGLNRLIKLWNASSGTHLRTLMGHEEAVWSVAFSPDGRRLVSGSLDKTVRLWDTGSGALLNTFTGHSDMVLGVAFSPDGHTLASGSGDHTVRLWDADTGQVLHTFQEPSGNVGDVAFSPDGRTLAAGSDDDTIRLWDVNSGALLRALEGHAGFVNGVAFSPDGRLLASGSHDRTVGLWEVESGRLLRRLEGHKDVVLRVAFSPDGRMLASVSWDGTVRLWGSVDENE